MAIDKAVDSGLLNADLTTVADAIRAKGGTSGALTFPGGFASAISAIAAGGGTLGIKSGTVTLSKDHAQISIEHGCGKLPYVVFLYPIGEFTPDVGCNTGGLWFYDYYAFMISGNMNVPVASAAYPYRPKTDTPESYSFIVNDSVIACKPAIRWLPATYQWIAIYEV